MTGTVNNLLAVLEERMHDLMRLSDDKQRYIEGLEAAAHDMNEQIRQAKQTIQLLESKYNHLLTARRLEADETEYREARRQVSKLVREVETCIALLNE